MKTCSIVDNDKEFLSFAERNLVLQGYQVHLFSDLGEFLSSFKLNPQVIIIGDNLDGNTSGLECIQQARKALSKSIIIHIGKIDGADYHTKAIIAGANEFIERNSASFVRLRTALDLIEQKNNKDAGSLFDSIKKVFTR